MLVFSNAFAAH